jgi:hypothetical protein
MSMICRFVAVDADKFEELRDDADAALDYLYEVGDAGDPERALDVDKAWHAIHFLLNQSAYEGEGPAALVIFGAETIGEGGGRDGGSDGEAPEEQIVRYITPSQVEEVAALLENISVEDLAEQYDPDAMEQAEIYPTGIWEEERQEAFDYVAEYYEQLVEFYALAAERGDAVLSSIG